MFTHIKCGNVMIYSALSFTSILPFNIYNWT